MRLAQQPPLHLVYCLNSHAGERFQDQWNAVQRDMAHVREHLGAGGQPFGLGLRIGNQAALDARRDGQAQKFGSWCRENNFYVCTINGFPYGQFHRTNVKSEVYRPDWTRDQRLIYTQELAGLLAAWLPEGVAGSISTVPLFYARDYSNPAARRMAIDKAVENLISLARQLDQLSSATGRDICLALEPEPDCFFENAGDVMNFFTRELFPAAGKKIEKIVRQRIGVCLDTCHTALAFEHPADFIRTLQREGIRLAKIQVSAALSVKPHAGLRQTLAPFAEPVYLHQTSARTGNAKRNWPDLAYAITGLEQKDDWQEARIHFHVPLDWAGGPNLDSTRTNMDDSFWKLVREGASPVLEIETYTYDVLPPALRTQSRSENIGNEYRWVMNRTGYEN